MSVVVITGASSGIGAATARLCAAAGMNVVLAARREELLDELAAACRAENVEALAVVTDVRSPESIDALMATAVATFGALDVVIANAGIGCHTPLAETTDAQLRDLVDVNILGVMRTARAAARQMIAQGHGHIMTVSSVSALLRWPNDSIYGATRAAVHRMALALHDELRAYGIAVTDVMPGVVDTALTEGLGTTSKASAESVARAIVKGIRTRPRVIVTPARYRLALAFQRLFRT